MPLIKQLSQLFFPSVCPCCGRPLVGTEQEICLDCQLHLPTTMYSSQENNMMEQCFLGRVPIVAASAYLFFKVGSPSQSLVHSIKYHHNIRLAHAMGRVMGQDLKKSTRFQQIDVLLPVPLHPLKQMQRGYNQSYELCRGMASVLQLPIANHVVARTTYTTTQTQKNRQERLDNLLDSFTLRHPNRIASKHVLIVDDVMTTGATIEALYLAIRRVKKIKISVATLALAGL